MQQRRQFQRIQRGEFGGLQHHRVSGHERGQRLRGRNGERIIPRRDNPDYTMRFTQNASRLGLHRQIAVRNRFLAQEVEGVFNAEARGIQHHQNFREQGFYQRLPGFPRNQRRNSQFFLVKQPLKFSQDRDSSPHSEFVPCTLRGTSASDHSMNLRVGSASKFAQRLTRSRIDRNYFPRRDLKIGSHILERRRLLRLGLPKANGTSCNRNVASNTSTVIIRHLSSTVNIRHSPDTTRWRVLLLPRPSVCAQPKCRICPLVSKCLYRPARTSRPDFVPCGARTRCRGRCRAVLLLPAPSLKRKSGEHSRRFHPRIRVADLLRQTK